MLDWIQPRPSPPCDEVSKKWIYHPLSSSFEAVMSKWGLAELGEKCRQSNNAMSRREFARRASLGAAVAAVGGWRSMAAAEGDERLEIHLFSKTLQRLGFQEMAEVAAATGFDGVELTVRPGGHVEPGEARKQFPQAADAIRAAGLKLSGVVTRVTSADDQAGIESLKMAANEGVQYYRTGYLGFDQSRGWYENLDTHRLAWSMWHSGSALLWQRISDGKARKTVRGFATFPFAREWSISSPVSACCGAAAQIRSFRCIFNMILEGRNEVAVPALPRRLR